MDNNEIYRKKREAEDKILAILMELEKETKMAVSEIEYSHNSPTFVEMTMENFFEYTDLKIKLSTL